MLLRLARLFRLPDSAAPLLFLLLCISNASAAQAPDALARDILETEKTNEQVEVEAESQAENEKKESTPLNTMLALRKAMDQQDWEAAGAFLDRRFLPEELNEYSDESLLRALKYVFAQQNIIDLGSLSDNARGNQNDGLPGYRDKIGMVTISSGDVPIYMQSVPDGEGGKVWKVSNATVAQIPQMWDELGYSPVAVLLSEHLPTVSFMGMDNWQLMATVLFFIIAWPIAMLVSYLLMRLCLLLPNNIPVGIRHFFQRPMRFFLYVIIVRLLIAQLGLSLKARILLESSGMDFIAWTVLLLGLMSLLRDYQIRKMQRAGNQQYVALIKPFTTMAKILVVTIVALIWAKSAGYDMSTIIAGLGVGSLAVALAAQKTLENVIGAITLYTARPVSAGDFCRFGDVTGTVEEIGLRSTLIRTLDRTLVVIPNSVFSSQEIENYSRRDSIRYFRKYRLQLPGTGQLQEILSQVRTLLREHSAVLPDTVSVRFETIEDANAILRLDARVDTADFQEFLGVAEEINLQVMDTVQANGSAFCGPGQLLQIGDASGND